MRLSSRLWFRVIVDLLHDLAAGAWPGAVVALWMIRNGARTTLAPDVFATVARTWSSVLLILLWALVVQVATGVIRLNYWSLAISPDAVKSRSRAAQIKHVFFALVYTAATVAAFTLLQP